jgi:Zn-dependent protease with chaperone function
MSLFTQSRFEFPYLYKFPGQASDERILFVTRENAVMLWYRRAGVVGASVVIAIVGLMLGELLRESLGTTSTLLELGAVLFAVVFGVLGWWWISTLWQKSLMIVTTQRLTKFIYTTPFNRHNLSLPLDMVVDTGSYTKGFIQALFRLNKKYFYIENVASAEDLQHYINKLLHAFRHSNERLATFRPFLPQLKGDDRKRFMEQYPEYWS